jgi:hypothetical protein
MPQKDKWQLYLYIISFAYDGLAITITGWAVLPQILMK